MAQNTTRSVKGFLLRLNPGVGPKWPKPELYMFVTSAAESLLLRNRVLLNPKLHQRFYIVCHTDDFNTSKPEIPLSPVWAGKNCFIHRLISQPLEEGGFYQGIQEHREMKSEERPGAKTNKNISKHHQHLMETNIRVRFTFFAATTHTWTIMLRNIIMTA